MILPGLAYINFSSFVFTGIVYIPISIILGFIAYRYYRIRGNNTLFWLLFYEFSLLTVVSMCGALSGTVFTSSSNGIVAMLVLSSFALSFSNAVLGYLFFTETKIRISPWVGFIVILMVGLVTTGLTITEQIKPLIEATGGINWGLPGYIYTLRAIVYFLGVLPILMLFWQRFIRSENMDEKRHYLFLSLMFLFILLIVIVDFILEPLLNSPALLSELAILLFAVISFTVFLIVIEITITRVEKRYRHLIENLKDLVFVLDNKFRIRYTNPAIENNLGYHPEVLKSKFVMEFVHENDRLFVEQIFNTTGNAEKSDVQFKLMDKLGNFVWVNSPGYLIPIEAWDSGGGAFLFSCHNITEIKKLQNSLIEAKEKAEEGDRLKTAFLATMSHEFRTPLSAIIGFGELIGSTELDSKKYAEYGQYILEAGTDLLDITDSIFDYSKLESGEISVTKSVFTLREFLGEITNRAFSIRDLKKKNNIDVIMLSSDEGPGIELFSDKNLIGKILKNFITNAFKFTREGFVELGVEINDRTCVFYVKDTGIGIPDDKQQLIFDRFRQLDDSHTRKFEGIGLGLAICKKISDLLGGEIWLTSNGKGGTTFYFQVFDAVNQ
nr:PAS domain S-box protein [Bacteroidota bacterium]